jgi:hypothetical protein
MASEIKTITSESLEAAYRALTPSQSGFTQDLMASNTIIPVLNLTAAAEGTTTGQNLQTALAFGSQTAFSAIGSTAIIANTAGFYRVFGAYSSSTNSATVTADINMSDGLTTKTIIGFRREAQGGQSVQLFDFVVFLRSGDSISAVTTDTVAQIEGSSRQIADVNGTLVNPSGFTPQ